MKIIIFVISLFLSWGLSAQPKSCEFKGEAARPHAIFLIHGLHGSSDTFGDLAELLDDIYVKTCKKNIRVFSIEYFTTPQEAGGLLNFHRVQSMHPFDFAKIAYADMKAFLLKQAEIDRINEVPEEYRFHLETPYSFIVHSQGGITAMSILQSCVYGAMAEGNREQNCTYEDAMKEYQLLEDDKGTPHKFWNEERLLTHNFTDKWGAERSFQVSSTEMYSSPTANAQILMTLGTPFWGSPTANKGVSLGPLLDSFVGKIVSFLTTKIPAEQISRLAIGGRGTGWQRTLMLNKPPNEQFEDNPAWQPLFPDLKTFNVSGVLPIYDPNYRKENINGWRQKHFRSALLNMLVNPIYYENDVIVGNPEARADFIYYVQNREKGGAPLRGKTQLTDEFYPLEMGHVPFFSGDVMGLAQIDRKNMHEHGSWLLIQRVFNREFGLEEAVALEGLMQAPSTSIEFTREEREQHFIRKLKNFTSEVKLQLPQGYHRAIEIKLRHIGLLPKTPPGESPFEDLSLASSFFVQAKGIHPSGLKVRDNFGQNIYHVGSFKDEFAFKPANDDLAERKSLLYDEESNKTFEVNGYPIEYTIDMPGFHKLTFQQAVLPSYNSYAEVFLDTYLPYSHVPSANGAIAEIGIKTQGRRKNKKTVIRQFILEGDKLISRINYMDNAVKPHQVGQCHVGIAGSQTPNRFRLEWPDENGNARMELNKIGFTDDSFFVWADWWKQLAQNQVGLYTQVTSDKAVPIRRGFYTHRRDIKENLERTLSDDELENRAEDIEVAKDGFVLIRDKKTNRQGREMVKLKFDYPDSVKPRRVIEILGRVTRVPRINGQPLLDTRAKTGRPCSVDEKKQNPAACDVEFIDRYLVTSYEIRKTDGIDRFNNIGRKTITDENGDEFPAGVRWMNVVDVDVFRPDQKVPVGTLANLGPYRNSRFTDIKVRDHLQGNECLRDRYMPIGLTNERFHYAHGRIKILH